MKLKLDEARYSDNSQKLRKMAKDILIKHLSSVGYYGTESYNSSKYGSYDDLSENDKEKLNKYIYEFATRMSKIIGEKFYFS